MSHGFSKLHALSAIRDDRALTSAERLVLVMLVSHAGTDGTCYPSLELLAKETGLARSTAAAALKTLRGRTDAPIGVSVARKGRAGVSAGGRAPNVYQLELRLPAGPKSAPVESAPRTELVAPLSPTAGLSMAPVASDTQTQPAGDLSPIRGEVESEKGWGLSPPPGLEAGQEAGQRSRTRSSKRSRPSSQSADSRVAELWAHYHAEHERLRKVAPVFTTQQRGAVGKSWKSLLEVVELDEAKQVVTRALQAGYHVQPTAIVANLNRYRGQQGQSSASRNRVPKQTGVVDESEASNWGKQGAEALVGGAE